MIDDPDIVRAARLLIDARGEDAAFCADLPARELLVRSHIEASALWRQVVVAIDELQRRPR